jgi:hypothetical protein
MQLRPGLPSNIIIVSETTLPTLPAENGILVPLQGLQVTRERDELVRIKATAPSPCLAVIAESYYPYWHAELDGKPVVVRRVSCGLMGIELATGPHEIVLRYEPPRAYAIGGVISLLSLIGFGVVAGRSKSGVRTPPSDRVP